MYDASVNFISGFLLGYFLRVFIDVSEALKGWIIRKLSN